MFQGPDKQYFGELKLKLEILKQEQIGYHYQAKAIVEEMKKNGKYDNEKEQQAFEDVLKMLMGADEYRQFKTRNEQADYDNLYDEE